MILNNSIFHSSVSEPGLCSLALECCVCRCNVENWTLVFPLSFDRASKMVGKIFWYLNPVESLAIFRLLNLKTSRWILYSIFFIKTVIIFSLHSG